MPRRSRNLRLLPQEPVPAQVESFNHDGRGVAHVDGKAVFIEGALPGEEVLFTYVAQHKRYDEGTVVQILKPSPQRVAPRCTHFNICGGCSLQHIEATAQIEAKQQVMLDNLRQIGRVEPEQILPPLRGPHWGYRRRARLGVKFVIKKDRLLVGFREKRSALLADLERCEVLHPSVGERLPELRALIAGLSAYQSIPQIEVAVGDAATALVFRTLEVLGPSDREKLKAFGRSYDFEIYLQTAGPESVTALWPETAQLSYRLEDGIELFFTPTDFVQINSEINRAMVTQVLGLLDIQPQERVLDLFCGLGNFTLPLARHAAHVVGVEGDAGLVQRAKDNALHNDIKNAEFYAADLSQDLTQQAWAGQNVDKILLDPPRTGALEIVRQLPLFGAASIVYVSCHPATLARDAEELVQRGYTLSAAGVMDMFPHTTHVESIALFTR